MLDGFYEYRIKKSLLQFFLFHFLNSFFINNNTFLLQTDFSILL